MTDKKLKAEILRDIDAGLFDADVTLNSIEASNGGIPAGQWNRVIDTLIKDGRLTVA